MMTVFAGGAPLQWRVMGFCSSKEDAPLEWRAPSERPSADGAAGAQLRDLGGAETPVAEHVIGLLSGRSG